MRQQDVWEPRIGPGHMPALQTLYETYEIGHIILHADPICQHLRWDVQYPLLVQGMTTFGHSQHFSKWRDNRSAYHRLPRAVLDGEMDAFLSGKEKISK